MPLASLGGRCVPSPPLVRWPICPNTIGIDTMRTATSDTVIAMTRRNNDCEVMMIGSEAIAAAAAVGTLGSLRKI